MDERTLQGFTALFEETNALRVKIAALEGGLAAMLVGWQMRVYAVDHVETGDVALEASFDTVRAWERRVFDLQSIRLTQKPPGLEALGELQATAFVDGYVAVLKTLAKAADADPLPPGGPRRSPKPGRRKR